MLDKNLLIALCFISCTSVYAQQAQELRQRNTHTNTDLQQIEQKLRDELAHIERLKKMQAEVEQARANLSNNQPERPPVYNQQLQPLNVQTRQTLKADVAEDKLVGVVCLVCITGCAMILGTLSGSRGDYYRN